MSGTYSGSVSFLGIAIDSSITVNSASSLDITISAAGAGLDGSCFNEAYHLDGSNIVLENLGKSGNCITDLMNNGSAKIKSSTYNSSSD